MTLRRWCFSMLTAAAATLYAGSSFAVSDCVNDVDCPNPACGGDVCQWDAAGNQTCVAAGTDTQGMDGWCTTSADCKCMAEGATCKSLHCTMTVAGGGGTGGSGAGGSATAGAATAGTGTAGTGTTSSSEKDDGGGCSIASAGNNGVALSAVVAAGAITLLLRRRKR
ncbi:MAG TPA: hypothetical protein VGP93_08515 [Polyangiaceae bacterium]|nr:hypothetical protein [Polyangiaceae bacterium]